MSVESNRRSEPDVEPFDLFSKCFTCGHEFKSGDSRLRFTLQEFGDRMGLERFPGDEAFDIGLCEGCTEPGHFKTPEIVP